MNSRTGQAGRDSSFNSLLKVLYPVQGRSEPIRPEVETGSLQNQSLDWAPALISLSSFANPVADTLFTSSCVFWRQAWWDLALTNQPSRYWWPLKSLCMAWYHGELCCGQPEWPGLELVCPTLDVKSQAFPGLFLYRYMDVGIPPSTVVLPKVQSPRLPKFPKRGLSLDLIGRLCATFGTFGILTIFPVPPDTGPVW